MSYFSGVRYSGRNIATDGATLDAHVASTSNPHNVTAAQVGNTVAQWNANKLQGSSVAAGTPVNGQLLKYNTGATQWEPLSLSTTGPITYNQSTGAFAISVGTTTGTVAAGDDARFSTAQLVRVKSSNPGAGEFTSIYAALASITDNSPMKPYEILVGPGIFFEPPLMCKPYVTLIGHTSGDTIIYCVVNTGTAVTLVDSMIMRNFTVTGANNTGGIGIYYEGTGVGGGAILQDIIFGTNDTNLKVFGNASDTLFVMTNVTMGGTFPFTSAGVDISANPGISVKVGISGMAVFINSGTFPPHIFNVHGVGTELYISSVVLDAGTFGANCSAFHIYDGAQVRAFSIPIENVKNGFWIENIGVAPTVYINGATFAECTYDIRVEHPGTIGEFSGVIDRTKMFVNRGSTFALGNTDLNTMQVSLADDGFRTITSAINFINPTKACNTVATSTNLTSSALFNIEMDGAVISGTGIPVGTTVTFVSDSQMTMSQAATITGPTNVLFTQTSTNNKYIILCSPGIYVEPATVSIPRYVSVLGLSNVYIMTASTSNNVFRLTNDTTVKDLTLTGASATGAVGVLIDSGTNVYLSNLTIVNCDTCIKVVATTGVANALIDGFVFSGTFSKGIWVDGTAATSVAPAVISTNTGTIDAGSAGSANIFLFEGPNAITIISSASCEASGQPVTGVVVRDGANVIMSSVGFSFGARGLEVQNVGAAPNVQITNLVCNGNSTMDLDILHPGTTGVFEGVVQRSKSFVDPSSTISIQYLDPVVNGSTIPGQLFIGGNHSTSVESSDLILAGGTMGLTYGGTITVVSGLQINVAAGSGYVMYANYPNHVTKKYTWNSTNVTLPASTTSYIYVDTNGVLTNSPSRPNNEMNIVIGRVRTDGTGVEFIDAAPMIMHHTANDHDNFHREAIGAVVASGLNVSGNTSLQLSISSGKYFFSGDEFVPSGAAYPASFIPYYHVAGSFTHGAAATVVDNAQYDNGTNLTAVPAGQYVKHAIYLVGDGANEKYFLVYGQQTFADSASAQSGPYPAPPTYFTEGVIPLCGAVVQQGNATYILIVDRRPTITVNISTITSTLNHGSLLGLLNDDHPQYLLVSGARAMSGALNMGTFNITNVGTVDGVTVSAHASRHLPNGADPLTTAAPLAGLSATTTNAAGTANSFARSDHSHAISTGTPVAIGSANAAGTSANLARADHVHQGVAALTVNTGTARFGTVNFVNGTGVTIVDDGANNFTFSSTSGSLIDNATFIVGHLDATKKIGFNVSSATTNTTTTINFAQTVNRTITYPDATTTLVGTDVTQTLTNKTVLDNSFQVDNVTDVTKALKFSLGGQTTGTTLTLTSANTANSAITFPNVTSDTLVSLAATQTLTNKTLLDTTTNIANAVDATKQFGWTLSGATTGTKTTIAANQTANRTLTLPDATDTLVGRATVDTLTNKDLTSNTDNVIARALWVGSGASSVSTYAATAPTAGQVLTATSGTTATWQTPTTGTITGAANIGVAGAGVFVSASGSTLQFKNINAGSSKITVTDDVANNEIDIDVNQANIDVNALSNYPVTVPHGGTGVTSITAGNVMVGNGTSAITFTKAAPSGAFVGTTDSQTLTNKNLVDNSTFIVDATDATKRIGFDASGTTGTTTTLLTTQSANRTITFPDFSDTVVVSAGAQTLTNKTLTSTTNNVTAKGLFSATTTVDVSAATAPTTGQALVATGASAATWQTISTSTLSAMNVANIFGNGADGSVTIAANTTLSADMYYNTLTVNAGVTLNTAGYAVYVKGACVINGTLASNGSNGGNASAGVAGTAGAGAASGSLGGGANGAAGKTGNVAGGVGGNVIYAVGSAGGTGGSGSLAGGAAGTATVPPANAGGLGIITKATNPFTRCLALNGCQLNGGSGGGSGGGNASASAATGGGGGGGGVVLLVAKTLSGSGALQAIGGNGGSSYNNTNVTGGSGGGGGGLIVVISTTDITSTSITRSVAGGSGSAGFNTGTTGATGTAGTLVSLVVV